MLASVLLGLLAALGRLSLNPLAYGISTFYTSFFRGTPLLLQVLLIYQGLPQIGPVPTAIPSGIIALALCYGAYQVKFSAQPLSLSIKASGKPRWRWAWKNIRSSGK